VAKVCAEQVDGANAITITVTNTGQVALENCQVTDEIGLQDPVCPATGPLTPVTTTPQGFNLAPSGQPLNEQVVTGTVADLGANACNTVSVTCTIAGTGGDTITRTAEDVCEVPPREGCLTRTPGFWGTHPEVTALFLPLDVCGISLSNVLAATAASAIEDVCFSGVDAKAANTSPQQLQLIRQCAAAALNFAASTEGGGSCEGVASNSSTIGEVFNTCCDATSLCTSGASGSTIGASTCISLLDAFNNSNDTLDCTNLDPNSVTFDTFCPSLGANGFNANPATCSAATGNGFVNPGRTLGPK
jgi:hypothetical protein